MTTNTSISAYRWHVQGISKQNKQIDSLPFRFGKQEFYLKLFPTGNQVNSHLSAYLSWNCPKGTTETTLSFSITFLHKDDLRRSKTVSAIYFLRSAVGLAKSKMGHTVDTSVTYTRKSFGLSATDHKFKTGAIDWGWTQMMSLSKAADLTDGDAMTIQLLISTDPSADLLPEEIPNSFIWINDDQVQLANPAQEDLMRHKLYQSRETTYDVIIVVCGIDFPCHKSVCATGSEYFNRMFFGKPDAPSSSFSEATKLKVELHNIDPEIFEILLRFIYFTELTMTQEPQQLNQIFALLVAAEFLQMDHFLDAIMITNDIAPAILDASRIVQSQSTWKAQALEHILFNTQTIPVEAFVSISFESIQLIIESFMTSLFDANKKEIASSNVNKLAITIVHWFHLDYDNRKDYVDVLLSNPKTSAFFVYTKPDISPDDHKEIHEIAAALFGQCMLSLS